MSEDVNNKVRPDKDVTSHGKTYTNVLTLNGQN